MNIFRLVERGRERQRETETETETETEAETERVKSLEIIAIYGKIKSMQDDP